MTAILRRICPRCRRVACPEGEVCDSCQAKGEDKASQKIYDARRGSPSKRGYDRAWQKARDIKLANYPLCERCEDAGRTTAATIVHHVVPVAEDWSKRLDQSNLMSLCFRCHEIVEGRKSG